MTMSRSSAVVHIPVFLPGDDRTDFKKIAGMATVYEDGEISIKLDRPEAAMDLYELLRQNLLVCCAFEYTKNPPHTIDVPRTVPHVQFGDPNG